MQKLRQILTGRVTIVGIGNRLKADDGFGPVVIEHLLGRVRASLIDAGTAPESYLGKIIKSEPDTIIILDIADIKGSPGSIDILDKNDILKVGFSTHDASPGIFMEFLENSLKKAKLFMVAVQPASLRLGGALTDQVAGAASKIEETLCEELGK